MITTKAERLEELKEELAQAEEAVNSASWYLDAAQDDLYEAEYEVDEINGKIEDLELEREE